MFMINNNHMKKILTLQNLLLCLVFILPAASHAQLLDEPQKIVIDAPRNRLLVSNCVTGDLVAVDSAGNQSFFIQGAGCVDGLEIIGDTVFGVGDNRMVRGYNLVTKEKVMEVRIPGNGNKYLSSIVSDSAGCLFISCPKLNEIYKLRISDTSSWVFAAGINLVEPNGILLERAQNRILVIGDAPVPSSIYAISLADSSVLPLLSTNLYRPDGIVKDKFGYYYIGGYYLDGVYKVDPGLTQAPVLYHPGTYMVYPTYDPSNHSLLITHYKTDTLERIMLGATGMAPLKPSGATLHPVTPNPFGSSVTLRYELTRQAHARLEVYDSSGVLKMTLLDSETRPGSHSLTWDGKSANGIRVKPGAYYFRLTVDGDPQIQKGIKFD